MAAVQDNARSIVLFRITGTDDEQPISAWETGWDRTFIRLDPVKLASLPPGFIPGAENRTPSVEAQHAGWRYLLLEPGSYRIRINTPYGEQGTWRDARGSTRHPSFWLNVPDDRPVIYAGSLHLSCSTRDAGTGYKSCSSEISLSDETEAATDISRLNFPGLGKPEKTLVSRYGGPLPREALSRLWSMKIMPGEDKGLDHPDWKAKAHERYFGRGDSGGGGGNCYGPGCGGLILFALVYWPIATALESSEVAAAERAWAPCMQRLADELRTLDIPGVLGQRLAESTAATGINNSGRTRNVTDEDNSLQDGTLEIALQRIQFRQCSQADSYCLELSVRVRLTGSTKESIIYDAILTYSNGTAWYSKEERGIQRLQEVVQPESVCSDLGRFCGAGGQEVLRQELMKGVDAIAQALID
ncbi:MAG: hypothetical protein WBO37_06845 [Gammaproteobacteria bacterium]